jgi:hypothetical protein
VNLHKLFPAAKLTLFSRLPAGLTTGQNHVIRKLFTISKLLAKITKNNQNNSFSFLPWPRHPGSGRFIHKRARCPGEAHIRMLYLGRLVL